MSINNIDLAYAAGYIDGDGCFYTGIIYKKKFTAEIIVTSTNEKICQWFKNKFKGCVVNNKNPRAEGHKILHAYRVGFNNAYDLTNQILPYLIEKKQDAISFMKFFDSDIKPIKLEIIEQMRINRKKNDLVTKDIKKSFEEKRNTIIPTENDFSYLAGYIDAEGCFTISRYKAKGKPNYFYKCILESNNTKSPVFLWILERFGGTIHFVNRKEKDHHIRDQFVWMVSANRLNKIIHKVYPYLKYKKEVCEQIIDFQKTIIPVKEGLYRGSPEFQAHYQSILEIREKIYNNVKDLNKKGTN